MKLDLWEAYNLVRIKERHEGKTAFKTRYGTYEYQIISFDLTNVLIICQALINQILNNCLNTMLHHGTGLTRGLNRPARDETG